MTIVQTPALALLPATLDRLATTAPHLQVEVHQRETAPALDELHSRLIDLVVGIEYDPVPVARHRDPQPRRDRPEPAEGAVTQQVATLCSTLLRSFPPLADCSPGVQAGRFRSIPRERRSEPLQMSSAFIPRVELRGPEPADPLAPAASNQTVRMSWQPRSPSHAPYSAGV
jgi:hypothetical protein